MRAGGGDAAHQLPHQAQCPQAARSERFLQPRQQLVLLSAHVVVEDGEGALQQRVVVRVG
jgi:hypothetical protein